MTLIYLTLFPYRLMNWLSKWYVNRKAKLPKPSPWAKNDDGGYFKAALLSGPPGVGKYHKNICIYYTKFSLCVN